MVTYTPNDPSVRTVADSVGVRVIGVNITTPQPIVLPVGGTQQLTAQGLPTSGTGTYAWSSSDPNVVIDGASTGSTITVRGASLGSSTVSVSYTDQGVTITDSVVISVVKVEFDSSRVFAQEIGSSEFDKIILFIVRNSPTLDLKNFLTPDSDVSNVEWFSPSGVDRNTGILRVLLKPNLGRIRTYEVTAVHNACSTCLDKALVVAVPDTAETAYNNWLNNDISNTDKTWLQQLPPVYNHLDGINGDPEPLSIALRCNRWVDAVLGVSANLHPGATYELRSWPVGGGHGHQATYSSDGNIITSNLGAGSADFSSPVGNPPAHIFNDVAPFVWAAQLDGNPIEIGNLGLVSGTLMRKGTNLDSYIIERPPQTVPNLNPLMCEGE